MAERAELKKLARGIVLAQGNRYIKELLRTHGIRIGATKADFQKNLIDAIDRAELTREHFDQWLDEIEGWGNQHVYLYRMPPYLVKDRTWRDPSKVSLFAKKAKLEKYWNAAPSLAFPEERALTGIYCDEESFRLVWHEGYDTWIREKDKDYQQEEGADLYEYRAHRNQPKRSVMRFEWPRGTRIAAVFLQIPWEAEEHKKALQEIWKELERFPGMKPPFKVVPIDEKIRSLDETDQAGDDVTVQSARLSAPGAYVDFVSTVPDGDYKDVAAVAQVHQAVEHSDFYGEAGVFVFKAMENGLTRDVKLQMYGAQDRMRFWAQCAKKDVWSIIDRITRA